MTFPPVGAKWNKASIVWGKCMGSGSQVVQLSPFGFAVQESNLLDEDELRLTFGESERFDAELHSNWSNALAIELEKHRPEFVEALRLSTGFIVADCEEIFDSCVEFAATFELPTSEEGDHLQFGGRRLKVETLPWGTVAAVLPQNAFLSLGLTVLLNALATGNRTILRAPTGSIRLAAMFGRLCELAGIPKGAFSLVMADASCFVDAWASAPTSTLLHFMGGSDKGVDLLSRSWHAGKPVLIDGSGNTWMYVDQDQDPAVAAEVLWKGATRYNGATCTSVNGAIIHPSLAEAVESAVRKLVDVSRFGCDLQVDVGPLFSDLHARNTRQVVERSEGIEHRSGNDGQSVFAPTLVVDPRLDSDMVREGVFAPALWISSGTWDEFVRLWPTNRYPLCAGVLSADPGVLRAARRLPNASRVVLNGDPSIEDPREPWGAYPRCGLNPVGEWARKYLRAVQIDEPKAD